MTALTEGLPEIPSVAELDIHEPLHARLSFRDSPAEPIVLVGTTPNTLYTSTKENAMRITKDRILPSSLPIPLHSRSNSS